MFVSQLKLYEGKLSIQVDKEMYICKEWGGMLCKVEAVIPFPANNLKQDYTKAENIWFYWE